MATPPNTKPKHRGAPRTVTLLQSLLLAVGLLSLSTGIHAQTNLPASYSVYDNAQVCRQLVNQGQCGASHVFASTSAVSTHLCLRGVDPLYQVSNQQVLTCAQAGGYFDNEELPANFCSGSSLLDVSYYLGNSTNALVSSLCQPYTLSSGFVLGGADNACLGTSCSTGAAPLTSVVQKLSYGCYDNLQGILSRRDATAWLAGIEMVKQEVYRNGPVVVVYDTCQSLNAYMRHFTTSTTSASVAPSCEGEVSWGLRAMLIVGWTDQLGAPTWVVQNSWGDTAGNRGFVYIPTTQLPRDLWFFWVNQQKPVFSDPLIVRRPLVSMLPTVVTLPNDTPLALQVAQQLANDATASVRVGYYEPRNTTFHIQSVQVRTAVASPQLVMVFATTIMQQQQTWRVVWDVYAEKLLAKSIVDQQAPTSNGRTIAIAVPTSIGGAAVLGVMIAFIVWWCKKKRHTSRLVVGAPKIPTTSTKPRFTSGVSVTTEVMSRPPPPSPQHIDTVAITTAADSDDTTSTTSTSADDSDDEALITGDSSDGDKTHADGFLSLAGSKLLRMFSPSRAR